MPDLGARGVIVVVGGCGGERSLRTVQEAQRAARSQGVDRQEDGAPSLRAQAPAAPLQGAADADAKGGLEAREEDLVEVLIGKGPGDVGAAGDLQLDGCRGVVIGRGVEEERQDGLEDEEGACGEGVAVDLEGARFAGEGGRGREPRGEGEGAAANGEALDVCFCRLGQPADGGDVLGLETCGQKWGGALLAGCASLSEAHACVCMFGDLTSAFTAAPPSSVSAPA